MPPLPDLHVAAVAIVRDRRVLMVTARGREVHYMPGGKIDPGESPAEAAAREAHEEVGIVLDPAALTEAFTVRELAHGQGEGRHVLMHVFLAETDGTPAPSGEIDAVHWVGTADARRCPPAGVEVLRRLAASGLVD
jgi:8-oxo-dGTP diphosphatase